MEKIERLISETGVGQRLDKALTTFDLPYSRSQLTDWIDQGNVLVNRERVKRSYKAKLHDQIEITVPETIPIALAPEAIDLDIVYEDDDLLVVNKPQGMVVHPANGHEQGTLVNALLHHTPLSTINGEFRPGIVHRIDKDTSGLLMVAKNDHAHQSLSVQLKAHKNDRIYYALVKGMIKEDSGTIKAPIGRHKVDRKKQAVIADGKEAITHFKVLQRYVDYTLLEVRLETGRTHQIRVHMAYINHPVVGDPLYGKSEKIAPNGQLLHAKTLTLQQPTTLEELSFDVDIPDEFKAALATLVPLKGLKDEQ